MKCGFVFFGTLLAIFGTIVHVMRRFRHRSLVHRLVRAACYAVPVIVFIPYWCFLTVSYFVSRSFNGEEGGWCLLGTWIVGGAIELSLIVVATFWWFVERRRRLRTGISPHRRRKPLVRNTF